MMNDTDPSAVVFLLCTGVLEALCEVASAAVSPMKRCSVLISRERSHR